MRVAAGVILALALAVPAAAQEASEAYFARNANAPDVKTVPAIEYKILKSGPADGVHPQAVLGRAGSLRGQVPGREGLRLLQERAPDGAVAFPLDGAIPGWVTVLPLMRPGDEWIIYLPPEYAYSAAGQDIIPPNTPLEFRIELLDVAG